MRQNRLMAIATFGQLRDADGVMGTPPIPAPFAKFSFW
jgi:hypothetical protein